MGIFDPIGLQCPITVQLKLVMRSLSKPESGKVQWDAAVEPAVAAEFVRAVGHLEQAKEINFARCVVPPDVTGDPTLVVFSDGSMQAICALVYIRWPTKDGFVSYLLVGKSKVGPLNVVSVVRMELMAAQLSSRMYTMAVKVLPFNIESVTFITDSTALLGMLQADSGSLGVFGGSRVGEIKDATDINCWKWTDSANQLADIGTRTSAVPADLGPDTRYQQGADWMRLPESEWPCRSKICPVPREELSSVAKCVMTVVEKPALLKLGRFGSARFATRVLARTMEACEKFRAGQKIPIENVEYRICYKDNFVPRSFEQLLSIAENTLLSLNQKTERDLMKSGGMNKLEPGLRSLPGFKDNVEVVIMSGRAPRAMLVGADPYFRPLISGKNVDLARLFLADAHSLTHGGVSQTVGRSRSSVWITDAHTVARSVCKDCKMCTLLHGKLSGQVMAPLPEERSQATDPFKNVALDLFGPVEIRDAVKKRSKGKVWILVVVCQASGAVTLEVVESYSTDSFLMAFRRFMSRRGTPSKVTSDRGSQIVGAARKADRWDYADIKKETMNQTGLVWKFVPAGTPHMNGQAERMVGATKKCMAPQVMGRNFTFGEIATVTAECETVINSRPYSEQSFYDADMGVPLTPQHLLGPRCSQGIPGVDVYDVCSLTKRFRIVQDSVNSFWKKYKLTVFPRRIVRDKWTSPPEPLEVGDICHLVAEGLVSRTWKIGRVQQLLPSPDGRVRKLMLYNSSGLQEVPVHRLRLIVKPGTKQG